MSPAKARRSQSSSALTLIAAVCLALLLASDGLSCVASAQEPLQFNVPYHCPDGTDKVITHCQSNARGEVCVWRDEKNGQLIGERFNIRSQMDGWLKICKVQGKPGASAVTQPAAQPSAPTALPTGPLNPPYLGGMPPHRPGQARNPRQRSYRHSRPPGRRLQNAASGHPALSRR